MVSMNTPDLFDPYDNNILISGLGSILSREEKAKKLIDLPYFPVGLESAERHIRLHHLARIRRYHMPRQVECRLADSIDIMVREGYVDRNPSVPGTINLINGVAKIRHQSPASVAACAVGGPAGSGKTQAILRCLGLFPSQVITHENLPPFLGPHPQVVWMSIDVPSSGKAVDLARALMLEWDRVIGTDRFAYWLTKDVIKNPIQALDEWKQVASTHFLGVLHFDEVQNFFKLLSLRERRNKKRDRAKSDLSVVEDQCLKWILTSLNSWSWPTIFSGTPDGMGALGQRMSTLQRLMSYGSHNFTLFEDVSDPYFSDEFMYMLEKYQYTKGKLVVDEALKRKILDLTAGVPRIIIALWIAANRVALERPEDHLRLSDFDEAFESYLSPLAPAVGALRSKDPNRLAHYEDMVGDGSIWNQVASRLGNSNI